MAQWAEKLALVNCRHNLEELWCRLWQWEELKLSHLEAETNQSFRG